MITKNKIHEAAASYGRQSVLESGASDGPWVDILSATEQKAFIAGATWMQEQDHWIPGIPDDYRTYMFMITFHEYGKPASQMLIGSISEETEELLDHDGQPTGWDKAHEVITHYRLPPNPPKTKP